MCKAKSESHGEEGTMRISLIRLRQACWSAPRSYREDIGEQARLWLDLIQFLVGVVRQAKFGESHGRRPAGRSSRCASRTPTWRWTRKAGQRSRSPRRRPLPRSCSGTRQGRWSTPTERRHRSATACHRPDSDWLNEGCLSPTGIPGAVCLASSRASSYLRTASDLWDETKIGATFLPRRGFLLNCP